MQVARNFFLSNEQTFSRKFNEILLAIKIERLLSKEDILELYVNRIYLGNRAYGVKAAAQVYYDLNLEQLNLAQMAMIAGLPKAPSIFNPIANPKRAKLRRDWILKRMHTLDKISLAQYQEAVNLPVSARLHRQNLELHAPYVAEMAREKALKLYGDAAYTSGYKIVTTIDSRHQQTAQKAIISGLTAYDLRHGYRGPEQQLDINALGGIQAVEEKDVNEPGLAMAEDATNDINIHHFTTAENNIVDLQPWLATLKRQTTFGDLEPAIVVRIDTDKIVVLTAAGNTENIYWEAGLNKTRLFVNENTSRKPPETPTELLATGDLIRIRQDEQQQWQLSQIPEAEAALISIRPDDGSIRSIVGGFDFNHSSFNRVTQAKRQPGSNFKPFIYTTALENNFTPASIFNDAPIVIEDEQLESIWRPENASGKFYGPTRLRKALYLSRNLVSIRLLRNVGIGKTVRSLERFGMDPETIPRDLSMALGSYAMSPLDLAIGYSAYANGGFKVDPYLIHHIRDRYDEVIFRAEPKLVPEKQTLGFSTIMPDEPKESDEPSLPGLVGEFQLSNLNALPEPEKPQGINVTLTTTPAERIIDERVVYIINSMLRDVIKRGTGRRALALGRNDLAGKTGTTNGPTDAWFSGFNHHTVTTTWVGFDNNKNLGRGEYGGVAALPIWIDYMKVVLDGVEESKDIQPDGIVTARIDPETGQRSSPSNPSGIFEFFLEENAPTDLPNETSGNNSQRKTPAPEDLF